MPYLTPNQIAALALVSKSINSSIDYNRALIIEKIELKNFEDGIDDNKNN